MKIILALFLLFTNSLQINTDNYEKMITDLENLENYIKQYITEKSYTSSSLTHLITCYIRLGAYTTTEWTAVGGEIPDDLASYITTKDEENGTSAQATQTYRDTLMPNGESIDFVHMFAVMNGIERGESYTSDAAHLVGWGGDTEQLLEDIMKETGDLEYLMNVAKENYFRVKGGFDEADLVSDLDGAILLYNKNDLSAARCKYLSGKIEGRLLYLYRFCLLKSDSKTDLKLLDKLEKFVKQNSLEIYKKLQYALVSKKCPIPYVFYWRIVHKRLPSIFRKI